MHSEVPNYINTMIQLLLEEEDKYINNKAQTNNEKNNGATAMLPAGPCLDYFLRERILQFLCEVCMKDVRFFYLIFIIIFNYFIYFNYFILFYFIYLIYLF